MDQTTNQTAGGISTGNGKTFDSNNESGAARERLMGDLKTAISDAEQWLRGAANSGADDLNEAKTKFQETLRTAKTNLLTMEDTVLAKTKLAAQATDTYVHDNPWKSVLVGGVVGLLLGVIISRD